MKVLNKIKLEDILFLDIETSTSQKEIEPNTPLYNSWAYKKKSEDLNQVQLCSSYQNEGALYAEFGRIVCISIGRLFNGKFVTTTYNDLDEAKLIEGFYSTLDKEDFILCGHSVKEFDIPFIFKRSIINGIIPHKLVDTSGEKPWTMDWILDTKELFQAGSFSRSSLLSIATALEIPSPKEGITGAEVPKYYWIDPEKNIQEISEYCERDVVATYQVLERFKNIRKVCTEEVKEEKVITTSLLDDLFAGDRYTNNHKERLLKVLREMDKEEQEKAFVVLNGVVSTAKGTKTKFTKEHIKKLKEEL